jgi:hypothetical protein
MVGEHKSSCSKESLRSLRNKVLWRIKFHDAQRNINPAMLSNAPGELSGV